MVNSETYEEYEQFPIALIKSETREPSQVISMQKSECETFVAVISGKILIMNQQFCNQLFIFKKTSGAKYEQYKRIIVKDIQLMGQKVFEGVCLEFHFQTRRGKAPDSILFVKKCSIIKLNFETEELEVIMQHRTPMDHQPLFFTPNADQTCFMIANSTEGRYVNINKLG